MINSPTWASEKAKPWPDGFNCTRDCNNAEKCNNDSDLRGKCSRMCPTKHPSKKFDPICVQEPKLKEKIKLKKKKSDDEVPLNNHKKKEFFDAIKSILDLFEEESANIKEKSKLISEKIKELTVNKKLPENEITEKVMGFHDYWGELVLKSLMYIQNAKVPNQGDLEAIKITLEILQEKFYVEDKSKIILPGKVLSQDILDQYQDIVRHDPPFFQLTLKNNKLIYILGSIHPRNPQILLSEHVFERILEIAPRATLCTEHKPYSKHYIDKIEKILAENPAIKNAWDMDEFFKLGKIEKPIGRKKKWDLIKNDRINNDSNLLVIDIQKLPEYEGRILFKSIVEKKDEKSIPGFESALRKLPWKNKNTVYLETVEEWANATALYDVDIMKLFNQSFSKLMKHFISKQKQSSEEEKLNISIEGYKNSSKSYGFDFLSMNKKIKDSVLKRNEIWVDNILSYLKENPDENELFIVCGIEHLRNESSFIVKIAKHMKDNIINIKRMNNYGALIPVNIE